MSAGALSKLTFHHMGLAVRDDEAALALMKAMGFRLGLKIFDPVQNVHVRLCQSSTQPTIEIVQPGEGKSPIDAILNRHNDLIYHLCYEIHDFDATVSAIRNSGLRMLQISARQPAVLFGGRRISFHKIRGFGIVEFLEPD